MKKAALKNFAIFTGNLQACNFIKKRLQHSCFPLNIEEHLLTATSDFLKSGSFILSFDNLLAGYEQLSY